MLTKKHRIIIIIIFVALLYKNIAMVTKLTPHFTLEELTITKTGLPNEPNEEQINQLRILCRFILEPLREEISCRYGHRDLSGLPEPIPLIVNSAFRSPAVNKSVGGVPTSQHLLGQAADINSNSRISDKYLYLTIQGMVSKGQFKVGQCIWYRKSHFVHVSLPTIITHFNQFIIKNK